MRLTFVRPYESVVELPTSEDLSDFMVLSGPNGSGKSQLLAAITAGAIQIDGVDQTSIRLLRLGQLVPGGGEQQSYSAYRESWARIASAIDSERANLRTQNPGLEDAGIEPLLRVRLRDAHRLTDIALDRLSRTAGKSLVNISRQDVRICAPIIFDSGRESYQWSPTELFLKYYDLSEQNEEYTWRNAERGSSFAVLDREEFLRRYGPPPWDLLNQTLAEIGLPYRYPEVGVRDSQSVYVPQLIDIVTGVQLSINQLSSGEQTLLAIAMSLYSANYLTSAISLPGALLLDEADASLHPSMAQALLRVLGKVFVAEHGVKVILTTHSPTTVALAEESALYVMHRHGHPRLKKTDRDVALAALTVGIPTLSVKLENRRQVVVESEHDERLYGDLYQLVRSRLSAPVSLEFLASGRGGQGNSAAVAQIVRGLRERGNDSVWGILDRDNRQGAGDGIVFCATRYAVENLVLDPLALAIYLYRERIVAAADLGLPDEVVHTHIHGGLALAPVQYVVNKVVRADDDTTMVKTAYCGDFTVDIPRFWLDINGKQLVVRIVESWPRLNRHPNLMADVVSKSYRDVPEVIPMDVLRLFEQI